MKKSGEEQIYYLIGYVSRKVGLSQKRIREYENEGFISPRRDPATNNRLYSDFDINQIQRIQSLIHEHGFTLACLKVLLVSAPCWNIFDCHKKDSCPASLKPDIHCYDVQRHIKTSAAVQCEACPVYRSRKTPKIKVLEKKSV